MSSIKKPPLLSRLLRVILLVLLVGLTPLFSLWNQNLIQIQSSVVLKPLWITILFILGVSGIWLLISRSLEKAALLACLTLLFFFTFGHAYNLVGEKTLFGIPIGFMKLLLVYLVVFAVSIVLVLRIQEHP